MILLDTHVLIWWVEDEGRLSPAALAALSEHSPPVVSPISLWELAVLAERGRVAVDPDVGRWSRRLLGSGVVGVADLSASAAINAAQLPGFHGDPADRFMYATARDLRIPFISKDTRIREYAQRRRDVQVIW